MLHPDKFDTISNNTKSLERSCSILEYPRYRFFFDSSYSSLNRSFRAAEMVNSH